MLKKWTTIVGRIKWNLQPPFPPPPPRQTKDEAAQTPKHAIFPSLPGERGEGNLVPRAFPLKKLVGRDAPPIF